MLQQHEQEKTKRETYWKIIWTASGLENLADVDREKNVSPEKVFCCFLL